MSIVINVLSVIGIFAVMAALAYCSVVVCHAISYAIGKKQKRKPMATMNGKLYVYTAGTTTTPDTYADSVKVYPNPDAIKRASEDTKQPDDAAFLDDVKHSNENMRKVALKKKPAMTAPIKRNKPKPAVKKAKRGKK